MSGEHEIEMVSAFVTGDHTAAYRVRDMLQAAGMQAEVCPARLIAFPVIAGSVVEGPWHVQVPDTDIDRARDLAERWQRRFGEQ